MAVKVFQITDLSSYMEEHNTTSFMYGKTEKFNGSTVLEGMANGTYEHVADLDVDSLNKAFEVGNIGPEEAYTRYKSMHSISVGDVLMMDDDPNVYVVADFGFDNLGLPIKEVQTYA